MPIKVKRWNDPIDPDDGYRLLITRYRPQFVSKADETWDDWDWHLGPSKELHADFFGKHGRKKIGWKAYRPRYLAEMKDQTERIDRLARMVAEGKTITLLCFCADASHCHRTLLKQLIEKRL
jgi:uncharacterized protein YeaO (DUF488 family)